MGDLPVEHKTTADVIDTALHYTAGAAIIGLVAGFSYMGKPMDAFLVALLVAAMGAIGVKMYSSTPSTK